ncbi:alpha-N-acetylgalactosaminidase-like [Haemaphysalis longicornis]
MPRIRLTVCFFLSTFLVGVECLNNGLALLPPMGWRTWQRFQCNTDPFEHYDECISESLVSDMADRMSADGFLKAGYDYLVLDDCWSALSRDSQGNLVPDPRRFPRGMKAVVDYVHSKGLKFGINAGIGAKTCHGYPGSLNNYERDAKTYAEWGVDFVNVDGCSTDPKEMRKLYPAFGRALNATGRPMLFSCEWPLYESKSGIEPDYKQVAETCNIWRNFEDVTYRWRQIYGAVQYEEKHFDVLVNVTGPGAWTDYGAVVAGNYGLAQSLQRAHVAYWAIAPSPMLLSVDLRRLSDESRALLLSPYVIAVNQDPLRAVARRLPQKGVLDVWCRWASPRLPSGNASMVVLVHNPSVRGGPARMDISISGLGLHNPRGYVLQDVLNNNALIGLYYPGQTLTVGVPPLDVFLLKATITDR